MRYFLVILLFIASLSVVGQGFSDELEKKLQTEFDSIYSYDSDEQKLAAADEFISSFMYALTTPGAFDNPFSSLKMGKLLSPDEKFRLFNWNVNLKNGKEKYYALIVKPKKKGVEIIQLNDFTDKIKNIEQAVLTNKKWFGALYYDIVPFKKKGKTNYILLGWDGHSSTSNKKVIEVMTFNGKSVRFGNSVFYHDKKSKKRIVFEYAEDAVMSLNYNKKKKTIFFSHLAPIGNHIDSEKAFFAPDMTFDAYQFKKGKWNFIDNIEHLRPAVKEDKEFNDPRKK